MKELVGYIDEEGISFHPPVPSQYMVHDEIVRIAHRGTVRIQGPVGSDLDWGNENKGRRLG